MRILIAEDDEALGKFVRQGLEAEHYAVDVVADGEQARAAATNSEYDCIILDLNLPTVDGVTILRQLRLKRPSIPVLVLTQRTKVEDRVQCLDTGADDYVPKQMSPTSLEIAHIRSDLISKIRAAAQSRRFQASQEFGRKPPASVCDDIRTNFLAPAVVAIGTSTGGPHALEQILPCLPADFPVPVLIVQHMPAGFTTSFAHRLNNICAIRVKEAAPREVIQSGAAYLCPAGVHMRIQRQLGAAHVVIDLNASPANALHVPSVDILMESVARVYRSRALGVIMTGMGADGLEGMKAIHREGGLTIGQDEATSAVYGMPRACAEAGVLKHVLPLSEIPLQLMKATRRRRPA